MSRRHPLIPALLVLALAAPCAAGEPSRFEFTRLDDFEDATPWLKGDPNTDLEQKDTAVTTSTQLVKEGKRSLAFLVRINWTKRPTEKYAKGWPMIRRMFDKPRDWSRYDRLVFWLHAKTDCKLLQERVLRIGFRTPETKRGHRWHTIPGIKPNQWVEVAVPLTMELDWTRISGIAFYVAEAWYEDGDRVDFYIDDMRLAKRTVPAFATCSLTSRVFPRGQALGLRLKIEGPWQGTRLRCRITDVRGKEQCRLTETLTARDQRLVLPTKGLQAGGHYGEVELLDGAGKAVDARKHYFRSLQPGKRCYLKLITFYTKPLMRCEADKLRILNDSAYAAVAIPLVGSYHTNAVPDYESLQPQLKMVRQTLKIDPWPWVALNRFIGAPPDRRGHASSHARDPKYFQAIKGMDLDNEAGARADLLKLWRHAARAAHEWKSPGIMIDLEAYNDYRAYQVAYIAKARGETIDEVIGKCEKLGADLAKIIQEEYPECIVWSLFSRLERSRQIPGREGRVHTTVTYITLGLLKYARESRVPLKYLCGGETTPGYCNNDVDTLKAKIAARDSDVAPFLEQFPDHFFLAGTISPFHDYEIATSWIQRGYKDSAIRSIQDFEPMFRTLFDAYDWVWIYASSAAKTQPYGPKNNRMYSEVLRAALAASAAGK